MTEKYIFIYVLTIIGSILNEDHTFIVPVESKNLALEIAATKLIGVRAYMGDYRQYCVTWADEFPTLPPMSYDSWLKEAINNEELKEVTITPKALVTLDNVMDLFF